MKRAMFGVSLVDRIPNLEKRQGTRVVDVSMRIACLKWRWAGHGDRRGVYRWTNVSLSGTRLERDVLEAGPPTRWSDVIVRVAGSLCMRLALDRLAGVLKRGLYPAVGANGLI